jgi:hypothetical protein
MLKVPPTLEDIIHFNIFIDTLLRVEPLINISKNGSLIWYSSIRKMSLICLLNCFVRLRSEIMFNNKNTLHWWNRHDSCCTNKWLNSNEYEGIASNHRSVWVTVVQFCHWVRQWNFPVTLTKCLLLNFGLFYIWDNP